ncbi:MAG TPA: hypothetical protein VKB20_11840 [Steroidobacteraceae bacterium]|nr:hypothetical protein [Steroidobacteraceae bacterium]
MSQHLYELYTLADWPFLYVSAQLVISGPTAQLPVDFVTAVDDHALQILSNDGNATPNTFALELSPEELAARSGPGMQAGSPPLFWAVSRSDTTASFWPNPSGHNVLALLRYRRLPPEPISVNEPADVPVFPYHNYLVQAVYVFALEHERDPRAMQEAQIRDRLLAGIRLGSAPVRSQRADIPLDPTKFRTPWRGWSSGWPQGW